MALSHSFNENCRALHRFLLLFAFLFGVVVVVVLLLLFWGVVCLLILVDLVVVVSTSFIPCEKLGSPYLGKATAAATAVLPIPQFLGSLTCAQMLLHAIALGSCTDTVKESALKGDSRRKIVRCTRKSNLPKRRAGPTFYQVSFVPALHCIPLLFSPDGWWCDVLVFLPAGGVSSTKACKDPWRQITATAAERTKY